MLQALVDYAIPANLFLLMLIAGTEVAATDFMRLWQAPRAVLIGSAGQLLTLPFVALLVQSVTAPDPSIAAGLLLLALCPGGGISNYYCFLARCDVLLSASITAVGTVLSLVTIPLWFGLLPALQGDGVHLPVLPTRIVLVQLLTLMILPMMIGILLRYGFPGMIESSGKSLRRISLCAIILVLTLAIWTVRSDLAGLLHGIVVSTVLFILGAMLLGWLLGYGLNENSQPVLAIESGVRNITVALILGGTMLSPERFAIFAGFLTGYFIVEIIIMLAYARILTVRASANDPARAGRA